MPTQAAILVRSAWPKRLVKPSKISAPPTGLMIENSDEKANRKALFTVAATPSKSAPVIGPLPINPSAKHTDERRAAESRRLGGAADLNRLLAVWHNGREPLSSPLEPHVKEERLRAARKVRAPARRHAGAGGDRAVEPGGPVRPPPRPSRRVDGARLAGASRLGLDLSRWPRRMAARSARQSVRLRPALAADRAPRDDRHFRLYRLGDDDDHRRRHGHLRDFAFRRGGDRLARQPRARLAAHAHRLGRRPRRHRLDLRHRPRLRPPPRPGAERPDDARLRRDGRPAAPPA